MCDEFGSVGGRYGGKAVDGGRCWGTGTEDGCNDGINDGDGEGFIRLIVEMLGEIAYLF